MNQCIRQLNPNNLQKQRGITKFGFLMLAIILTIFLTVGLKLAPLYMDHNLITGICEGLIENGQASSMSIREVRERVANSLRINAITDFELSNITMRKNRNREATITIAYERRVALFGNLDMIAKFDTVLD